MNKVCWAHWKGKKVPLPSLPIIKIILSTSWILIETLKQDEATSLGGELGFCPWCSDVSLNRDDLRKSPLQLCARSLIGETLLLKTQGDRRKTSQVVFLGWSLHFIGLNHSRWGVTMAMSPEPSGIVRTCFCHYLCYGGKSATKEILFIHSSQTCTEAIITG